MCQRLDERKLLIIVNIFSLITSSCILSSGLCLVEKSRAVSENIGLRVYQVYGGAILEGIKNLLPSFPGIEEVIKELDIVIHDVLINDIGDTLDTTVVITGIVLIVLASLQIVANSVLLCGTWSRNRKLVPSALVTRIFFFSTFWGIIDSFRKTLDLDELSVVLV